MQNYPVTIPDSYQTIGIYIYIFNVFKRKKKSIEVWVKKGSKVRKVWGIPEFLHFDIRGGGIFSGRVPRTNKQTQPSRPKLHF